MILEAIAAGLLAGVFGALVGLGGGVLLVPILALVFGLPLNVAIPASLVGVVATAMGGTGIYLRDGHTDWRLALRVSGLTMLGAMAGAKAAGVLSASALYLLFAALLIAIAVKMLFGIRTDRDVPPRNAPWLAGGLFAGAGFIAGLLGVGGGVLNVPAVHLALRRNMLTAAATSTMIIAFTAAAGAAAYAAADQILWPVAAGCATGAFAGGRLGALLAPRVPRRGLQSIFVMVLLYVAVEMGVRGLGLEWWR